MPELPDIVVYILALEKRILGQKLEQVRVASPFLLRTAVPPLQAVEGRAIVKLRRMGKRICIGLEGDLWLVLHLMIAGRLHWKQRGVKLARPRGLAAFDFPNGSLLWTEAGTQKRASLHVVAGEENLRALDPGGLEVLEANGVCLPSSCREGLCRSCEVPLASGVADHRDYVLSEDERVANKSILICVSRSKCAELVLDI